MNKLENMEKQIYNMRQALYVIINERNDLLHLDVIEASQKLDQALNEYNKLLNKVGKNMSY